MRRVVFNQKGGVGKSSITVNLAAISAAEGNRTLVVDLDPQCNASQYLLGMEAYSGGEPRALIRRSSLPPAAISLPAPAFGMGQGV